MYSSIRINGYRGLDSFRMEGLGRVNLLVGTNNSGKTSILECIELLRSAGDPHVLSSILGRRGELDYAGYQVASAAPGGVVLKLRGIKGQVPIGSMGGGMWRMLGLALSLVNARGGILLVDEIDTGLHYSVMEDMWRMMGELAAALSVQVFATTHSRDCYESLAAIVDSSVDDVTIQRIDRTRREAVGFINRAIVAAAERNIEVR